MYDVNQVQITNALETCKTQLKKMEEDGVIDNKKVNSEEVLRKITGSTNLNEALSNSFYIQVRLISFFFQFRFISVSSFLTSLLSLLSFWNEFLMHNLC